MPAFPAARIGDTVTHDIAAPSGVISPPLAGPCPHGMVVIEGQSAAHVNCMALCMGTTMVGFVPSPLHTVPVPVVVPGSGSGGGAGTGGDSSDGSGSTEKGIGASKTTLPKSTKFTIQVLAGSVKFAELSGIVGDEGRRFDHLVLRIEDSDENVAIYEYTGDGPTKSKGLPFSSADAEFKPGLPQAFPTHSPYTLKEFGGAASLAPPIRVQRSGTYGLKLAKETVDLEIELKDPPLLETRISTGYSEGDMVLKKLIPKPPPPVPPPAMLPVPSNNPIIMGSRSVFIHGMPAARWAPSGDVTACLAMLGDPKLLPTRTVWVG